MAESSDNADSYYTAQREDLVELLPADVQTVLEVGCGTGGTGKLLRARGCREIVGVELNAEAAQQAREVFDKVLTGDVEKLDLSGYAGRFDAIIYGDVLEHLVDPWQMLLKHIALLRPGGLAVASIPNVRHYSVIRDLALRGKWKYRDRGILDRTHLRFFTYACIKAMFKSSGFVVEKIDGRPSGSKILKFLNRLLFGALRGILVRQYKVLARKPVQ